jgi:hypothetical protein
MEPLLRDGKPGNAVLLATERIAGELRSGLNERTSDQAECSAGL